MYKGELGYKTLLADITESGSDHVNRTATDTKRLIARTLRFDLSDNSIPVFTTKKVHWKSVVIELLWFLSGQTNVNFLQNHGVRIWNEWASEDGELGPVYGKQFRNQGTNRLIREQTIDPLANFIKGIKDNPSSRRHIISLWNSPEIPEMNLPPCHGVAIQASVIDGELYLEMYQRSCDMFLGVPFNVASYSLFAHMIAKECGLKAKEFIWHGHDCHIYNNHKDQIKEQMSRDIRPQPKLINNWEKGFFFGNLSHINDYDTETLMNMFQLEGYDPHPTIKAEVAV
jgi:thymidylate synthase